MSQVENTHSTASPRRATDTELAVAYAGLEEAICDLRSMTLLMAMVSDSTVSVTNGPHQEIIKKAVGPMEGYRLIVLTNDEADGLEYSIQEVQRLADDLRREFYSAFERKVA